MGGGKRVRKYATVWKEGRNVVLCMGGRIEGYNRGKGGGRGGLNKESNGSLGTKMGDVGVIIMPTRSGCRRSFS